MCFSTIDDFVSVEKSRPQTQIIHLPYAANLKFLGENII